MSEWNYPDLRNGTTLHHITDNHFGDRFFTTNLLDRVASDMAVLKASHQGHVHTGDMVMWRGSTGLPPEDSLYTAWRGKIKSDGKPYAEVPGNHDLGSYGSANYRTKEQWATAVGVPSANSVTRMGDMIVIGLSPDVWMPAYPADGFLDPVLSPATLSWLDTQLTLAGSTPVWLANHVPPVGQYSASTASTAQPGADVDALIAGHPNVVGWLSGHWHVDINNQPDHVRTVVQGGRNLFAVNAPAAGGLLTGVDQSVQQWASPAQSMFVTYLGGAIDVRWRDHSARRWTTSEGAAVKHLLLTA